jgi:hypothetical protein
MEWSGWIILIVTLYFCKDIPIFFWRRFQYKKTPGFQRDPIILDRLPFDGDWKLLNTGEGTVAQLGYGNHHVWAAAQRFAFDAYQERQERGSALPRSYDKGGKDCADYFCWQQPLYAAHAGTVRLVVTGLPDEEIGSPNEYMAFGNGVMIEHPDGWVSVYAHVLADSVAVRVGDQVLPGDLLGLCGNSGNTTEPHLHFHVQDRTGFTGAHGLRIRFRTVSRNGERVETYRPETGDTVAQVDITQAGIAQADIAQPTRDPESRTDFNGSD